MYEYELPKYYTERIVLSREQEKELITAAQSGSKEARDTLVLSHLSLVVYIAKTLKHADTDTINMGIQGLIISIDRFNLNSGNRFATFARHWVIQKLMEGIYFKMNLSRMSHKTRQRLMKGHMTDSVDIPEELLYNLTPSVPTIEEDLMKIQLNKIIRNTILTLKKREREIVVDHIMKESHTLKELGDRFGVSRERIRQIEEETLSKLKIKLKKFKIGV